MEKPVLKGEIGDSAVLRIEMVHPTVKGAENFCYQIWPVDETYLDCKIWDADLEQTMLENGEDDSREGRN